MICRSNGVWAMRYRTNGCSVIPLRAGEKRPQVRWTEFQTRRPTSDEIRRWWTDTPDAGVAIICGTVSGLIALDVDPRNGANTSLKGLELPVGPAARTGGGGEHFLMAMGAGPVGSVKGLLPGVDLQADGSYIVAPPSIHPSGHPYSWLPGRALGEAPLGSMPSWVRRLVRDHQHAHDQAQPETVGVAPAGLEGLLNALSGVRRTGRGWQARCPAHDDHQPSLSIGFGVGGRILMHCFAGCSFQMICRAIEGATGGYASR